VSTLLLVAGCSSSATSGPPAGGDGGGGASGAGSDAGLDAASSSRDAMSTGDSSPPSDTCTAFGTRGSACCANDPSCSLPDPSTWTQWCQIYQRSCATLAACFYATDCQTLLQCVQPTAGCDGG
jgi:hypothetical protein